MRTRLGRFWGRTLVWAVVVAGFGLFGLLYGTALAQGAPAVPADAVITNCANDAQLRAAVSDPGTSRVTFDCGPGVQTMPISAYMDVQGKITVDGENQIVLDGAGSAAFFQVFATAELTLQNITLRRGTFNGAHALDNFGKLTLDNVQVLEGVSAGVGGMVMNNGSGRLLVRDSLFETNTALFITTTTTYGGAIYSEGVATVQDSEFRFNRVQSLGGAIAVQGGHFAIERTLFFNNSGMDGGALSVGTGTVVTVTTSVFDFNVGNYGGAIESSGELQVDYSRFTNNVASVGDGGAIWVLGSDLDVTYSSFISNTANTTGGAVSCYSSNVSIINSTLSSNAAKTTGGGLYSTCNVNMSNTTLHNNSAEISGGGIHMGGSGFASLFHVTVAQNESPVGAGVYNDGTATSNLTLQASLLSDNEGADCDGTVDSNGYNFASDNSCGNFMQAGDQRNVALPLGALKNNGGPTLTQMPLPSNPAINAIPTASCSFSVDQRDVERPQGAACDAGAIEVLYWLHMPRLQVAE